MQLHPAALFPNAKSEAAIQETEMGPDDGAGPLRSVESNASLTIIPAD